MDEEILQRALDCANGELRKHFELSERLPGKSGAWRVQSPDGEQAILKVFDDSYGATVAQTIPLVEQLRAAGYQTPRPLHHGKVPRGGYFYLQERLPGQTMRSPGVWSELNQHELGLLLSVLDMHAGLAPDVSLDWTRRVEEVALNQKGEWEIVAQSPTPAVQNLLDKCERRCAEIGDPGLSHGDLVIGDFGPHNVLLDGQGRFAAVIDLESAGRGDRVIDVVGLLYMVEPDLLDEVRRAALEISSSAALGSCGAYWIVHRMYLGIRANDERLELAAERMLAYFDFLT